MLRKLILLFLLSILFVSCATSNYVNTNPVVTSTTLSVEEKMNRLGFEKVNVSNLKMVTDGSEWAEQLEEMIDSAQNYILMTSFLASESLENKNVYEALERKAKSGVRIYFVYDSMTKVDATETKNHMRPISYLRESGVNLFEYNPFTVKRLINPVAILFREHRKIVVVDGHSVAVGGMNINYSSMQSLEKGGQRDSMFIFESEDAAKTLKRNFIKYWNTISYDEINEQDLIDIPVVQGESLHGWLIDQNIGKTYMSEVFGSLFYSAKESILILPLLPLADDGMLKWSKDADNRNVDVEMILPNDPRVSLSVAKRYVAKDLIDAGMDIFNEKSTEETIALLHEKLVVVDSRYVLIGSVNFNHRSMMLSQEVAVVLDSPELAEKLTEHFEYLKSNSWQITPEQADEYRTLLNMLIYSVLYIGG